jgi:hypothetical protein
MFCIEGWCRDMETEKTGKKGGGQKGNQNARKHGFYSRVLDEKEQAEYEKALLIEGIDEEIAMLRVKIIALIERDPENIKLITRAVTTLLNMVKTRHKISKKEGFDFKEAAGYILKNIALPMGVGIGTGLGKK